MIVGSIYNKTNFTGELGTNLAGTLQSDCSIVSNKIHVVNSTSTLKALHLTNNDHCFEKWRVEATVTLSANSNIGVGQFGIQTFNSRHAFAIVDTSTNTLKLNYLGNIRVTKSVVIPTGVPVKISLTYYRKVFTLRLVTDTTAYAARYRITMITENDMAIGAFSLFSSLGTADVSSLNISVLEETAPKYLFFGDSITDGSNLTPAERSYPFKYAINKNIPPHMFAVHASGSTKHSDFIKVATTVAKYQTPKYVFILLGDNDNGNNKTTWEPDRNAIIAALPVGTIIRNLTTTPETGDTEYFNLKNDIVADYTNVTDVFTPLHGTNPQLGNPAYYTFDGVHPNQAGQDLIEAALPVLP